ncbi:MAG: DUF4440 domain-containing protein [Phycisphaerales bacterium]
MTSEQITQLRTLEESHLQLSVRADRDRLASVLHESFTEIGASGNVWTREAVLEHLPFESEHLRIMDEFQCSMLSESIALTTYRVTQTNLESGETKLSRRSSVWCRGSGGWQLRFHQGTHI